MGDRAKTDGVVESRTSMVEGASPAARAGNSNNTTTEDQDRLAAAFALAALPDSIRSSQKYTTRLESPVLLQSYTRNKQNGFQHIPIQALPTQPGRSTISRAVAKPKPGSIAPPNEMAGKPKGEKKKGNTNKGKSNVIDASRQSKGLTIAQYYQKTSEEIDCAKIRNVSSCNNTPETSNTTCTFTNIGVVTDAKDVHSTKNSERDLPLYDSHAHTRNIATTEQSMRYMASLQNVADKMQVHVQSSITLPHVPVHILPSVAASNGSFIQPVRNTSNVVAQSYGKRQHVHVTGTPTIMTISKAMSPISHVPDQRQCLGLPVTINRPSVSGITQKESDVTSVDISTLSLPTNAGLNHEKYAKEISKVSTKIIMPQRNTPKSVPVCTVDSVLPAKVFVGPTPNMSEIALSNLEDKHRPLSLMLSQVALQYLEPNQGPVRIPSMATTGTQGVLNKPAGLVGKSQCSTTPKRLSLPITIPEVPPSRSSLVNTPGKVGSNSANLSSSFTEMFPISNHNPLLPRVFHSFLPLGNDGNLQPTDLSMKKTLAKNSRSLLKTDFLARDQPQDLSMSKIKKKASNITIEDMPVVTSLVATSVVVTGVVESKVKELQGDYQLAISKSGKEQSDQPLNDIHVGNVIAMGQTVVNSENSGSLIMPPLVPGIPLHILHGLIAQGRAGMNTLPIRTVSDTTVNSLPGVVMSTGHREPGSPIHKPRPDTPLIAAITSTSVPLPNLHQVVNPSLGNRTTQSRADQSRRIPDTHTSVENKDSMIGTANSNVNIRGVETLSHTEIEQNKLPPKKRRRYPDYQNNDVIDSPQNSPAPVQGKTNTMPSLVTRVEEDASSRKGAYRPPSSSVKDTLRHTGQSSSEKCPGPLYINTSSPTSASGRTDSPSNHSSPSETRSTDSPVHVDPRMNLIMLKECQMAVKPDDDGDLPLHIAVVQGEEGVVDRLIPMMQMLSSPVDQYNDLRQTPLHLAIITKELGIVTKLLQAGASPNLADRKGQTGVHLAVCHGFPVGLNALLRFSKSKLDLDVKNYEGLSPLHIAVQSGNKDLVEILLQAGAEVDTMDGKSGKTPLYNAAELNHDHLVRLLLENGANVNIANYSGSTPMSVANAKGYYTKIVNLLLKYGADPGSNSNQGLSASPSPTPTPSIRQVLRQSLSKGENRGGSTSRGITSPPDSAPSTPRPRKRAAKTSEDSQQPWKFARSESHDPSASPGYPLNPASPMIVASSQGTSLTNSPVTPMAGVDSSDAAEEEGESVKSSQPLSMSIQQGAPTSDLAFRGHVLPQGSPSMVTQPFRGHVLPQASPSMAVPPYSRQQTAQSLPHTSSLEEKYTDRSSKDCSQLSMSGHTPGDPGTSAMALPSDSSQSSSASSRLPVVVSVADGQMVFTVPNPSIAGGHPIPEHILPRIGIGLPQTPHSSSTPVTQATISSVPASPSGFIPSAKESPKTSPSTSVSQGTGSKSYERTIDMVLGTSESLGDYNKKTDTAEVDTTDSSDSFMIDESSTLEDDPPVDEAATDTADEDDSGDSLRQPAAVSAESSDSPSGQSKAKTA